MTNPMASLGIYIKRLDSAAQQLVDALDMAYETPRKDQEAYSKYLEAVSNYKSVKEELYDSYFPATSSK